MVVSCYPQKPGCNAYGILWRSRALGHHDDAFPIRASFRKWEMPAVGIAVVELPGSRAKPSWEFLTELLKMAIYNHL